MKFYKYVLFWSIISATQGFYVFGEDLPPKAEAPSKPSIVGQEPGAKAPSTTEGKVPPATEGKAPPTTEAPPKVEQPAVADVPPPQPPKEVKNLGEVKPEVVEKKEALPPEVEGAKPAVVAPVEDPLQKVTEDQDKKQVIPKKELFAEKGSFIKPFEMSFAIGYVDFFQKNVNWRSSGSTELRVAYKLPYSLLNFPLIPYIRYTSFDVAPNFRGRDRDSSEYVGHVEALSGGAETFLEFGDSFLLLGGADIGPSFISLEERARGKERLKAKDSKFFFNFSCGLDWKPHEKMRLGPTFRVGLNFAGFNVIQLGIISTFML